VNRRGNLLGGGLHMFGSKKKESGRYWPGMQIMFVQIKF